MTKSCVCWLQGGSERLWALIRDLLDDACAESRHTALWFLRCIAEGQECAVMRTIMFRYIRDSHAQHAAEDAPHRLALLATLTNGGQNIECFEEQTIYTASQETQSPNTKLFGKLRCSDSSTETVNLMRKSKKNPTSKEDFTKNPKEHVKCECKEKEKKQQETCCTKSLPKVTSSQSKTNKGQKHKDLRHKDTRNQEQDRDDTFSFTSCSLKKLISSESPRLMMALIVIAGALAIMLAIKCMCAPLLEQVIDRERRSNDDDSRKPWETSKSRLLTEFTELVAKDAPRDSNLHSGEDYNEYAVPDLASILDPIKVGEGYGSNNLRDFYRKLLKTDIQIKNLKKGFANSNRGSSIDLTDPINRMKRSAESTDTIRMHLQTLNKPKQEPFVNNMLVSEPIKVNKNNGKNSQHSFDGIAVDPAEKLEEMKDQLRRRNEMFKHEYEVDSLLDTSEPKHDENIKHSQIMKLPAWLNALLLNRGTSSTRHRRLLQLDDDDDDDGDDEDETLVDYEEQTKMQRGSEKTPVLEVTIDQKKVTKPVPKTENPTAGKELKKPTSTLYNDEINFLIDAAWTMKSDDQQNQETNEKPNASYMDNFIKKLKHKMFLKDFTQGAVDINVATGKSKNSTRQEIAPKHKDRNFMFVHRRSLKSIENEDTNDEIQINDSNVESDDTETLMFKEFELDKVRNITDKELDNEYKHSDIDPTHKTLNNSNASVYKDQVLKLSNNPLKNRNSTASWGLGDIFGMIADFCMFMTGFDTEQEDGGYRFLFDIVKMLYRNKTQAENKTQGNFYDSKSQIDVSMDSEMVANIGHRSRVLLSIEENVENVTSTTGEPNESYVITNKENINTSKENNKVTNSSNEANTNKFLETENRTVVKRSAGENNIFWNDMYDEEYGIKELEDDMKDKSAVKLNDLVGKDNWISAKFKTLAKSFKNRKNRSKQQKDQNSKNVKNNTKTHNAKRSAAFPDESSKRMFEDLTVNMKRVCHEAAEAIHETNNREVRADSEQATTLMQQLVGLMAELVDLQVKEKTCIQLPEDLRTFLTWLTTPNKEERHDVGLVVGTYDSGPGPYLNPGNYDFMSSNARSECLGTIHDVEDLILQYDEMSEEDKSKMSGVREYLEHQLHYLHKQLSNFNEYGSLSMYRDPSIRMRREQQLTTKRHRKRFKFFHKHTKMTATTSDDMSTNTNRISNKKANNKGRNYNGNDNLDNSKGKDKNVFGNIGSHGKDLKMVLKNYFGTVKDNGTVGKHSRA